MDDATNSKVAPHRNKPIPKYLLLRSVRCGKLYNMPQFAPVHAPLNIDQLPMKQLWQILTNFQ